MRSKSVERCCTCSESSSSTVSSWALRIQPATPKRGPSLPFQQPILLCSGFFDHIAPGKAHGILFPKNLCIRWKLALSMIAEILDVGTYTVIFYLINSDRAEEEEVRRNLGILMLSFEGLGFVLIFVDQGLSSLSIIKVKLFIKSLSFILWF